MMNDLLSVMTTVMRAIKGIATCMLYLQAKAMEKEIFL